MRRFVVLAPILASALGYQISRLPQVKPPPATIHFRSPLLDSKYSKSRYPTSTARFITGPEGLPDAAKLEKYYQDRAEEISQEKAEARKIMTMVGYRVTSLVFMALSLSSIAIFAFRSPASLPLTCYVVSGPMLASGVSYTLEGAAVNDNFFSGTFKRLNMFLGFYGFFWLLASFFARHTQSKILLNPIVITAAVAMMVNSFKAWTYGVKGWRKSPRISRFNELLAGTKETVKVLCRIKNVNGAIYLGGFGMVGCLKMTKLIELAKMIKDSTTTGAMLSKTILRYAMLSLLTGVMLTLKDAGDREQLRSTSFIELNTIASYVLGVMSVYYCQVEKNIYIGAASLFFSVFSATNGYLNAKDR